MRAKKVCPRPAEVKYLVAFIKMSSLIKDHFSHSSKPNHLSLKIAKRPYQKA